MDSRWLRFGPPAAVGLGVLLSGAAFLMPDSAGAGPLLAIGVLVTLVGGMLLSWWLVQRRAAAMAAFAAQIGWTYVGTDSRLATRYRGTPFGIGRSPTVSEVMVGTYSGSPATSFVYRYVTGSGKSREVHVYHVVTLGLPAWLPGLQLTPQWAGTRVLTAFGAQDLQFESEDFNKRWRVEARDEKYAHDVLHPRTLERLVRPDARGLCLRIEGSDVITWVPGVTDTEKLAGRLGVMAALVDGIPRFVWLDNGYDPSTEEHNADAWRPHADLSQPRPPEPTPPRYDRPLPSEESPRWTP